jgi:hypothetical protein
MNTEIKTEIGETAGQVWKLLESDGPQTLAMVKKKVSAKPGYVEYALGWLAREDKIEFAVDKRTCRITLK